MDAKELKSRYKAGERSLPGIDLSRLDLSFLELSYIDLSRADLNHTNLKSARLCAANLSDCDLSFTDLSSTDLTEANLCGANLSGANLQAAILENIQYNEQTRFPRGVNLKPITPTPEQTEPALPPPEEHSDEVVPHIPILEKTVPVNNLDPRAAVTIPVHLTPPPTTPEPETPELVTPEPTIPLPIIPEPIIPQTSNPETSSAERVFETCLDLIETPPKSPDAGGLQNSDPPSIGGQGGAPQVFETAQTSSVTQNVQPHNVQPQNFEPANLPASESTASVIQRLIDQLLPVLKVLPWVTIFSIGILGAIAWYYHSTQELKTLQMFWLSLVFVTSTVPSISFYKHKPNFPNVISAIGIPYLGVINIFLNQASLVTGWWLVFFVAFWLKFLSWQAQRQNSSDFWGKLKFVRCNNVIALVAFALNAVVVSIYGSAYYKYTIQFYQSSKYLELTGNILGGIVFLLWSSCAFMQLTRVYKITYDQKWSLKMITTMGLPILGLMNSYINPTNFVEGWWLVFVIGFVLLAITSTHKPMPKYPNQG
jgi:Pentapeptide repeats (8 copies)